MVNLPEGMSLERPFSDLPLRTFTISDKISSRTLTSIFLVDDSALYENGTYYTSNKELRQLPPNRIYLMSMAASGKSTFAHANRFFSGYRIVDFASRLPRKGPLTKFLLYLSRPIPILQRAIKNNKGMTRIHEQYYFDSVCDLMRNHDGPIAVLGRRLPSNFSDNEFLKSVSIGMVIISEDQHRRNCLSRREEMRNPLPYFHHWTTNFGKVLDIRKKMALFAEQNNVEIFDSFGKAIDELKIRRD